MKSLQIKCILPVWTQMNLEVSSIGNLSISNPNPEKKFSYKIYLISKAPSKLSILYGYQLSTALTKIIYCRFANLKLPFGVLYNTPISVCKATTSGIICVPLHKICFLWFSLNDLARVKCQNCVSICYSAIICVSKIHICFLQPQVNQMS